MKKPWGIIRYWPAFATAAIFGVWLFWPRIYPWLLAPFNLPFNQDKLYDALNVLFAGLGIVGLLYTLYLQRRALKDQKEAQTESEMRLVASQRLLAEQLQVLKDQAHRGGVPRFIWRNAERTNSESKVEFVNDGGDIMNARLVMDPGEITGGMFPEDIASKESGHVFFKHSFIPYLICFEIEYTHRGTQAKETQPFGWERDKEVPAPLLTTKRWGK